MLFAGEPSQNFPSLQEAAAKPKKKKGVHLKFTIGCVGYGGARRGPAFVPKGPTLTEMLSLPTGPRERTAEELEQCRFRGGLRYYGYGAGGGNGAAPPNRRPDYSLNDDSRRRVRADEVDSWASTKKFTPTLISHRQERYGFIGNIGASKADGVDNWSFSKKSTASPFRDSTIPSVDSYGWVRGAVGRSLSSNGERERPRLLFNPRNREPPLTRPSPFGTARPREEVLAEKGLDWRKMETEIELKKGSSPTSSQSSRPSSIHSSRPGSSVSQASGAATLNARPSKVNPFGNAKPREVLLEEKGMDWRKIDLDLEHHGVERPDTDEEKILKEEIDRLRNKLAKETRRQIDRDYAPSSTEQIRSLLMQICQREKELTQLIHELDDKVRFGGRASMDIRPGSNSGRIPFFADRPSSQSRKSNDSKNMKFMERPRSQWMNDNLSGSLDDRCGFHRRDSGFLASRRSDRSSKISERW